MNKFIELDWLALDVPFEKIENLKAMYGDDRDNWPEEEIEYSKLTLSIDVYSIATYNETKKKDRTHVRVYGDADPYLIDMNYRDFKTLVNHAIRS